MRIAWISTPDGAPSRAGALLRELLPHLRPANTVELFVEAGREGAELGGGPGGERAHSVAALRPRQFDQVLYSIGDEAELAFMLPLLRRLGGTVVLDGWRLPVLARAAYPSLERGGLRGAWLALREGGAEDLRRYRARRRTPAGLTELTLNRSVVRHADAFVVADPELALRIRADRNAHTPIAVIPSEEARERARLLVSALESFPQARSARRPLVLAMLRAREELRARERASSE